MTLSEYVETLKEPKELVIKYMGWEIPHKTISPIPCTTNSVDLVYMYDYDELKDLLSYLGRKKIRKVKVTEDEILIILEEEYMEWLDDGNVPYSKEQYENDAK